MADYENRAAAILLPGQELEDTQPLPQPEEAMEEVATETFSAEAVYEDVLGNVTGTPKGYYVRLSNTPTFVRSVFIDYLDCTASCALAKNKRGEYTPYLMLRSSYYPFIEVEVTYAYASARRKKARLAEGETKTTKVDSKLYPALARRKKARLAERQPAPDRNFDDDEEFPSITTGELDKLRRVASVARRRGNSAPAMRDLRRAMQELCVKYDLDPKSTYIDTETGVFKRFDGRTDW
jgi:hypothetical protein